MYFDRAPSVRHLHLRAPDGQVVPYGEIIHRYHFIRRVDLWLLRCWTQGLDGVRRVIHQYAGIRLAQICKAEPIVRARHCTSHNARYAKRGTITVLRAPHQAWKIEF